MAKSEGNVVMHGVSGTVAGQLVFKQYAYGTVVSKVPDMSNVVPTEKQLAEKGRFKRAVEYARKVLADEALKAELLTRTPKGKKVYHQAISEFIKADKEKTSLTI